MSGHNKWSTIKRKKGANDAKRSKIFSKIIKEINVAVKESGSDPSGNPRLKLALQNARGANMPKDNIDRAINKATSENSNYEEITFEGYAQGGVAIFIECLSDNNNRTISNIRSIFNKRGGNLGTNGSLKFIFYRKGIFTVVNKNLNQEEFELEMIEAGAEDIEVTEDKFIITTALEDFGAVQKRLDALNITVENAELQRIPNSFKNADLDTARKVLKIVEAFEDDDDVQNVFHNLEMTQEIEDFINSD